MTAERPSTSTPRKPEEFLKGQVVEPRPGHSFDELDLLYFAQLGAKVDRIISPENYEDRSHWSYMDGASER